MALPPTIPTSFVPRPAASSTRQYGRFDFFGAFVFVSGFLLALAIVGAGATFLYNRVLVSAAASKDATLQKQEAAVDQATITSLVNLQEQLSEGKQLLDQHIALSQFLQQFAALIPTQVTFSSMSISVNGDHSAAVGLSGSASNFNTLAVLSTDLATNLDIKDAIFSGISIDKTGVSFTLAANIDPSLIEMQVAGTGGAASTTAP